MQLAQCWFSAWAMQRTSTVPTASHTFVPICMGRGGLFAYGTADATAISKPHRPLPYLNPDWFNVPFWLVPAFPGCPSGGR